MKHSRFSFIFTALIIFVATTLNLTQAERITCPRLECADPDLDGPIDYDLCMEVKI